MGREDYLIASRDAWRKVAHKAMKIIDLFPADYDGKNSKIIHEEIHELDKLIDHISQQLTNQLQ